MPSMPMKALISALVVAGASGGESEPHASNEDLRDAGEAKGPAANHGGAALGVLLGVEAGLPQRVDADGPGDESHRPVAEIIGRIEPHTEMIGGEGAETREQGEEDCEGEHEGD